ncbi:MAG: hypothetical protein COA33_013430 [Fluviicola sp.]|nr:hypothetical protein [Fluviicola sp.]
MSRSAKCFLIAFIFLTLQSCSSETIEEATEATSTPVDTAQILNRISFYEYQIRENQISLRLEKELDSLKRLINYAERTNVVEVIPVFDIEIKDFADSVIDRLIYDRYTKDSINISFIRWDNDEEDSLIHISIGLNLEYRFQTNENIYIDIVNKKVFELDPLIDSLILLDY